MSMRERACVRDEGERGVLSCVEMRGKTNILHHVPSHTFPHWFGLFKSCCQWCLSASLSLCLGLRELLSTFWTHRQTALGGSNLIRRPYRNKEKVTCRRLDCCHLLVDDFTVRDAPVFKRPVAAPPAAGSVQPGAADHGVQRMSHL